jgi:adenosylcobinamide amidohydrolase
MIGLRLVRPWLELALDRPLRALSFAPHRSGFVMTDRILWREVRNADLHPGFDAEAWLADEMAARDRQGAVGMMTSRDIGRHFRHDANIEGIAAACVATVGLGNAETVGRRLAPPASAIGTINIAVVLSSAMTEIAQIEALTIAAEARTAAVMESGLRLRNGAPATGTGTDCIVIVAPPGTAAAGALRFAGLHTAVGEAIGRVVRGAVLEGAKDWIRENGGVANGYLPAAG